jgi:hypothetical protein
MAAADVNGDQHPDLVVAGQRGTIGILLNRGDGVFTKGPGAAVNTGAMGMAVADLNHDGKLDVIVSAVSTNQFEVLLGNGDGSFQAAMGHYYVYGKPRGVVVEDFSRDGVPDVTVVSQDQGVSLFYGNGDGTFQGAIMVPIQGGGGNAMVSSDFDRESAPDLAVNTGVGRVAVLMNYK